MPLGMAESGQHESRGWADVSLPTSPLSPAQQTFIFSIFSSPELCIFYLPQLSPCKEAAAAASMGLQRSLSTAHLPAKRSQAAADQPRGTPLHPLPAIPAAGVPWGWLGWAGDAGHSPVWLVTGSRLSQYCSWTEAATGLSQRRNACMGREQTTGRVICAMCRFPSPQSLLGHGSRWVRSELVPQSCTMDTYPFAGWVSQPGGAGLIQPGAVGLMLSALFPTPQSSPAPNIPLGKPDCSPAQPLPGRGALVLASLYPESRQGKHDEPDTTLRFSIPY